MGERKRLFGVAAILLTIALLASACGDDGEGDTDGDGDGGGELQPFTMMFPVQDPIQFYPWYLAQELGYYDEEGLDVTLEAADGSSAAIQQLIAGNADTALPAPGAFLVGVASGQPLKWIYSLQYSNIFTLVAKSDAGISTVADLEGRSLGISELSGGEVPLVRAVLRDAGLTEGEDVELVPVGEGSALTIEALETGQIDAYSSSVFDVAAIEAAGIEVDVILPEDAALFPADGVVTTEETLSSRHDDLVGFLRAASKAIVFANANPDAALEILSQVAPEAFEDEELAQRFFEVSTALTTPPEQLSGAPIGSHYVEGFQQYHDFLLQGSEEEGALPEPVDLEQALDESLLEEANDFDHAAIEDEAAEH
jgi:ABC-type nitrate/sulfonate/bicarbonate transport system substrate-binding protein